MPKSSWASPKAMRGKCERRRGSVNADGGSVNAGAEVQTQTGRVRKPSRAMRARKGRLSAPWPRSHSGGAADVYIIIRVRASGYGESALNPADRTTHSPPKTCSRPRTATRPSRALPRAPAAPTHAHAAPMHARKLCDTFSADLTTHSPPKTSARPRTATRPTRALSHSLPAPTHLTQRRRTPAGCAMHFPPTSQPIPRRRPSPAPHSDTPLPFCSASGTKKRHRTVDVRCRMSRSTVVAVGHWGW